MLSEGRNYLRKVCRIVLDANPDVDFAAILDENGKLIAAKSRSQFDSNAHGQHIASISYVFYLQYVIPGIRETYSNCRKVAISMNNAEIEFVKVLSPGIPKLQ